MRGGARLAQQQSRRLTASTETTRINLVYRTAYGVSMYLVAPGHGIDVIHRDRGSSYVVSLEQEQ